MTDAAQGAGADQVNGQQPNIRKHSHLSLVWLLPLLALGLTLWLAWRSISEAGIEIRISFPNAEGIEVGITPVRYLGMEVGKVTGIELSADLSEIWVVVRMQRETESMLSAGTDFWLVSPQATLAGISGLDTLVTGNYISMRIGNGQPQREYIARGNPPLASRPDNALLVTLHTPDVGSIGPQSPVYFRKIAVGEVLAVELAPGSKHVEIQLYIRPEYAALVKTNSKFWNVSGIAVSADLSGVEIQTESLASLLTGGIAFNSPQSSDSVSLDQTPNFPLYTDFKSANAGIPVTLYLPEQAEITPGTTRIRFRGVNLGYVEDIKLDHLGQLSATAMLDPRAEPLLRAKTRLWLPTSGFKLTSLANPSELITGPAINLAPGSGAPRDVFKVHMGKPLDLFSQQGLLISLYAETLQGLTVDSPLVYEGMNIGSVVQINYQRQKRRFDILLHVEQDYRHLIRQNSMFWNISGVQIEGGLQGFQIRTSSVESLLSGGIALSAPDLMAAQAKSGDLFRLFADQQQTEYTGPQILLHLADAQGLALGSELKHRGVVIGKIDEIQLSSDLSHVIVQARLKHNNQAFARQGANFTIQKAEFSGLAIKNIDSLLSGPWIQAEPGKGPHQLDFYLPGVDHKRSPTKEPLRLTLVSRQLGSVSVGSQIYYRQVPVGEVVALRLGPAADKVIMDATIQPRYRVLVRTDSRFWKAGGLQAEFGLFKGARLRADSLQNLFSSGINLATPDIGSPPPLAKNGRQFVLFEEPEAEWMQWQPVIPLPDEK